jgi:hypothetical protein
MTRSGSAFQAELDSLHEAEARSAISLSRTESSTVVGAPLRFSTLSRAGTDSMVPLHHQKFPIQYTARSNPNPSGLNFVLFSFTVPFEVGGRYGRRKRARNYQTMNQLRLLESQGRSTAAVRRQIEKALVERERHAT